MNQQLKDVVLVAYGRSPVTRAKKGALKNLHPVDLGAQVLKAVLAKVPQMDLTEIGDTVIACAKPEGKQSYNIARLVSMRAGVPFDVPAQTINRFCASGLQAIYTAANIIRTGDTDIAIAGGVEMMSTFALGVSREMQNDYLADNTDAYISNGHTAENVAVKYKLTRRDLDQMGVESHAKAAKALEEGRFDNVVVPVMAPDDDGKLVEVTKDEGVRPGSSLENLAGLKPFVKDDGIVTAGNSSQMNDAAAMVVLMSADKAKALGIKPIAKLVGCALAGLDPAYMGEGPILAVPKLMQRINLTVDDMDVIEINEAFAAQAIPCIRETGMDYNKVNPNGGAIALGHPLAASGVILTIKAVEELARTGGKYGLVTMCIGGGMGMAGVFEKL